MTKKPVKKIGRKVKCDFCGRSVEEARFFKGKHVCDDCRKGLIGTPKEEESTEKGG